MLKKYILPFTFLTAFCPLTYAENTQQSSNLDISGALRFQYTHQDNLPDSGNRIDFSDAVLWVNYHHDQWHAHLDYRAYQNAEQLGGLHFPVSAWVSYDVNPQHKITAGLQPVPIGLDRFFGSSYNLTQLYALGLEDIHNWGITYQYRPEDFNLTLGYFFADAGNHRGQSQNSAHYSSNLTSESTFSEGTQSKEQNQIAIKIDKDLNYQLFDRDLTSKIGASYLISDVKNLKNQSSGEREIWSIFHKTQAGPLGFNLIYGAQDIDNADEEYPDYSTFGAFDGAYNVANQGRFLSTEINYTVPLQLKNFSAPLLYSNYSRYFKDHAEYQDSERLINGVYTRYKDNFQFYLEHIRAKNDRALGAADGYANGKDQDWDNLLFLSLGYYF